MNVESNSSPPSCPDFPTLWLDQMHQAVLVVSSTDSRILYTNEAASTLLCYSPRELDKKHLQDIFPDQNCTLWKSGTYRWETLLAGNEKITMTVKISVLQEGYWIIQPLSLENGVETLLNQLQVSVLVATEGKVIYGNDAFSTLAKLPFEEYQGRTLDTLFGIETKERILNFQTSLPQEHAFEAELLVQGNPSVAVEIKVKLGLYLGKSCLWITLQNITKRKIAEEQQKRFQRQLQEQLEYSSLIFDQLPIGGWLIDFKELKDEVAGNRYHQKIGFSLSIRLANDTLLEMLGFTFNELVGKSIFDPLLVNEANAAIFQTEIVERRKGSRGSYEITLTNKQGEPIPVLLESIPILTNDAGDTIQSVGLLVDLTERKRWESELTRLNEKLENLSRTDALTGLGNRRTFDDHLLREWEMAKRENHAISLILIDVDFFKNYNDHYGHLAGDQCLVELAGIMQHQFRRAGDVVARYGGEEFAVILPHATEEKAKELAVQLGKVAKEAQIPHAKSTVSEAVTLSLGVSTLRPKVGDNHKDLVHFADEALYQSKAAGRNRTTSNPNLRG